jgi:hypothetical protein
MPLPCQLTVASFNALDSVYRVQYTGLTVDWTLECCEAAMLHPFLIYQRKNLSLLRLNIAKHCSESATRCWFWSIVSTRGTYFAHSFRLSKNSFKICPTRSFDIFRVSAISINFTLRSFKFILWTFLIFSSETAYFFHRPLRVSPSMHILLSFNLANYFSTVDFAGAESK